MEIINNQYLLITFQEDKSLLTAIWKNANPEPDVAKSEIATTLIKIKEHKPNNILVDSRMYKLRNDTELQKWISYTYMLEVVALGVKKYAIIVDSDYFNKLSKDEDPNNDDQEFMILKYFDDFSLATEWLSI